MTLPLDGNIYRVLALGISSWQTYYLIHSLLYNLGIVSYLPQASLSYVNDNFLSDMNAFQTSEQTISFIDQVKSQGIMNVLSTPNVKIGTNLIIAYYFAYLMYLFLNAISTICSYFTTPAVLVSTYLSKSQYENYIVSFESISTL